jgi:hypothetical protein
MNRIIINIKDHSKLPLIMEFLNLFSFIEIQLKETVQTKKSKEYDFFNSAGLWKNRKVDPIQLRIQAWTRKT